MRVGILGVGIAGRARVRAVRDDSSLTLVGGYRGRFAAELEVSLYDTPGALMRSSDLLIVCSPSDTHADYVSQALDAGCHVICEYPLAPTADAAEALFARADAVGRVLHVEHLGVLSPTTRAAAERVREHGIVGGALDFTSGGSVWPGVREHALQQLERVHRWVAAVGALEATKVDAADGATLDLRLRFADAEVALRSRRGPDLARGQRWTVQTPAGVFEAHGAQATWRGAPLSTPWKGLFALDLRLALGGIREGRPPYVPRARELEVLRWVDAVASAAPGAWVPTPVQAQRSVAATLDLP